MTLSSGVSRHMTFAETMHFRYGHPCHGLRESEELPVLILKNCDIQAGLSRILAADTNATPEIVRMAKIFFYAQSVDTVKRTSSEPR